MVENRPLATFIAHMVLVLGVIIVAFPVYITFVASTQTAEQIVQNVPMSMVPGDNMLESYRLALFGGQTQYGSTIAPVPPPLAGMRPPEAKSRQLEQKSASSRSAGETPPISPQPPAERSSDTSVKVAILLRKMSCALGRSENRSKAVRCLGRLRCWFAPLAVREGYFSSSTATH